jgi:hypothetical protein
MKRSILRSKYGVGGGISMCRAPSFDRRAAEGTPRPLILDPLLRPLQASQPAGGRPAITRVHQAGEHDG